MSKSRLIVTLSAVIGISVLIVLFAIMRFLLNGGWGGMRPDYAAVDYDPQLTTEAKTAKPYITVIQNYASSHGGSYPPTLPPVQTPSQPTAPPENWRYTPDPAGNGFYLTHRLGWDPSLEYHWDGTTGTWTFDPGDGSPMKRIALNP